jgi:alpha-galactosidase
MGWQTWCSVGPCGEDHCTDGQIRAMADTLVAKDGPTAGAAGVSMLDLGYDWIVLDDCWHPHRAPNGSLVPFERFVPHGMKAVIDYVHSLGLNFGLCASAACCLLPAARLPAAYLKSRRRGFSR